MHFEPNQTLTDQVYSEIISRIQEDDNSVPVERGPFTYYSRTVKGLNYPIYARTPKGSDVEEILLDQNKMAHEYMDLGAIKATPDHKVLGYALDTDGSENYAIYFKDLASGALINTDTIPKAAGGFVWTNDSEAVYYTTLDCIHRPYKVFRHVLGSDPKDDQLIFHETDEKFFVGVYKSNSEDYIFIHTGSTLTEETYYLEAKDARAGMRFVLCHRVPHSQPCPS